MIRSSCRLFIFFLIFQASSPAMAQGTWTRMTIPTTQFLRSVCFVDSLYGWVAGDSGTILHTTDGGNSWVAQGPQTSDEVECVFFLNRTLGWATVFNYTTIPYGTIILKTTDGGSTWQSIHYPVENIFMSCILFTDPLKGWAGQRPGGISKTIDGGITWTSCAIDTSILAFFPVEDIKFYNDKYGYACGGILDIAGVIWRTSDGGDTWYAIDPSSAPADEVHGLHLFDSINVMGAGGDPDFGYGVGMIRTTDGGLTWTYDELNIQGNAWDLDFRNATEAWAPLGPKRKLIYSLDAGITWTPVLSPDSTDIHRMAFPDSLHGYAVGKNGAFLKYHPPVIPGVVPKDLLSHEFSLLRNYPNPVRGTTTFTFTLPDPVSSSISLSGHLPSPVVIRITDLIGNEVASLTCRDAGPGLNALTFDAGQLPGGCYIYSLQVMDAGHFRSVAGPGRMIVVKERE